ncbi:hypothetical protein F7661_25060 [Pseudomonas sp. CFA]|nr:hypothetical protein F7661_25060 [Pseudomonas sp. CFA]
MNPLLQSIGGVAQYRGRSGFTREEAGPASQYTRSYTVAAATAFAGKTSHLFRANYSAARPAANTYSWFCRGRRCDSSSSKRCSRLSSARRASSW